MKPTTIPLLLALLAGPAHAGIGITVSNPPPATTSTSSGTHTDGASASFKGVTAETLQSTGTAPSLTATGAVFTATVTVAVANSAPVLGIRSGNAASATDRAILSIGKQGGYAAVGGAIGTTSDGEKILLYENDGNNKTVIGFEPGYLWNQIWSATANPGYKWYRGSTLDMILYGGNLGVGTATPLSRVSNAGDLTQTGASTFLASATFRTATANQGIEVRTSAAGEQAMMRFNTSATYGSIPGTNKPLGLEWYDGTNHVGNIGVFWDGTYTNMYLGGLYDGTGYRSWTDASVTIKGSGEVGISTRLPQGRLHVGGSAAIPFIVGVSTLVVRGDTGNLGIGTASPASKLHVSGDTSLQGVTTISGSSLTVSGDLGVGGITLNTVSSKFGIGTTSPEGYLSLADGTGWRFSLYGSAPVNVGVGIDVSESNSLDILANGSGAAGRIAFGQAGTGADPTSGAVIYVSMESDGGLKLYSRTKAQLQALTPKKVGEIFYCSDCANSVNAVVSTGTVVQASFDSFGIAGTVWQ